MDKCKKISNVKTPYKVSLEIIQKFIVENNDRDITFLLDENRRYRDSFLNQTFAL